MSSDQMAATNDDASKIEQIKQHIDNGEPDQAADLCEELLPKRTSQYGDMGFECAEVYFLYGKALLECSRAETNELLFSVMESQALPLAETVKTLLTTPAVSLDKVGEKPAESQETETETKKEEPEIEEQETKKEEPSETDENEENEEKKEGDNDNIETTELAWQWLETARAIYQKEIDKTANTDSKNKLLFELSDVLSSIGQLCLEIENHEVAMNDLKQCLEIRKQLLPENDRLLAETHFYLGIAFQINNLFPEALAEFHQSRQIIEFILNDASLPEITRSRLQQTLTDMNTKVNEVQQQIVGEDKSDPKLVAAALDELKQKGEAPAPVDLSNRKINDMGVFGLSGVKRSRDSVPTEQTDEPSAKHAKTAEEDHVVTKVEDGRHQPQ